MDFQNNNRDRSVTRYNSNTSAVKAVQSLDKNIAGLAQQYFGLDLRRLPEMSDQELGAITDRANQMERLLEALPILEKHFKLLIEGQAQYEQFLANVQKDVVINAKAIDKNVLDAWLLSKGYEKHVGLMGQKASNGVAKLEAENRSSVALELLDFKSALQLVARRHQRQTQKIQNRLPDQIEREKLQEEREARAEIEKDAREKRKDLLTNGYTKSQGRGFWDWFSGK